ncbi:MAG: thiamine pyrophosphate-binding protein, partial [Chloroflexota bacterium]
MAGNASDVLIDVIHDWGVDVVFGLPGDGIDGVIEALREAKDR